MDSGTLALRGTMFVGSVVMIVGGKRCRSGAAWAHVLAVVGAAAVLGAAGWDIAIRQRDPFDSETSRLYQEIAGCKLGTHLAEEFPNSRVFIIVDPECPADSAEGNPVLNGLRMGLGEKVTICGEYTPDISRALEGSLAGEMPSDGGRGLPPEALAAMVPREMWYTSELFDDIVGRFGATADIVISTIGLPADADEMQFWTMDHRPELAVMGGGVWHLRNAIGEGAVCAAVAERPDARHSGRRPPADLDAAFTRRYILLTGENVVDVVRECKLLLR